MRLLSLFLFTFSAFLTVFVLCGHLSEYDDKFDEENIWWSDQRFGAFDKRKTKPIKSFQPGFVFQFRYDSQTTSGYAPWVSVQRAMGRFQALVSFEMVQPGEAKMQLSECLVGHLNGHPPSDVAWNPAHLLPVGEFESVTQFSQVHLERPIRFTFSREGVHNVFFEPMESAWSRNIKKAILSTAQFRTEKEEEGKEKEEDKEKMRQQTKPREGEKEEEEKRRREWQRSYTVHETSIEGTCDADYTVVPLSHEQISVTKSINYERCTRLADIVYGMQADEEAKQRGEQQKKWNKAQKRDEEEPTDASGASPMIARRFLDRSTTVRFLFSANAQNSSNSLGLDLNWPFAHSVEMVSQYVLKGSEAEQSQAMQTVAVAKIKHIGTKLKQHNKRRQHGEEGEGEKLGMDKEQLMYNGEMEQQEKCFFMFGDEQSEILRCYRRAKAFTNDELRGGPKPSAGASRMSSSESPFPLNFPNSTAKIRLAEYCIRQIVQLQNDETVQAMSRTELMDEFVQILRFSTEKELQQLKQQLDDHPIASQLFADSLAVAGTRNTLKMLLTRIEQGEFTELKAAQMLKTFSRGNGLPAPSDRIADALLALCKSGRVQDSELLRPMSWLSFGAIVGELMQLKRLLRISPVGTPLGEKIEQCPDHKMELYTKALLEQFTSIADDNLVEKTIALKAIGNAALDEVPKLLADLINPNGTEEPKAEDQKRAMDEVLRQNAIEALRRIPSQSVHQLLLPVFTNRQEWPQTRISALDVLMQSQLSPSNSVIDQIAFAMAKENCSQLLAYAHSMLKALSQSPAKRHQKIAQRIKEALLMAGVDTLELEQRIRRNDIVGISRFSQTNALFSEEEGQGILLQASRVFTDKTSALPNHAFVSLSSLFNGEISEENLKMTISQRNIERLFTEAGIIELLRNEQETEEQSNANEQKKDRQGQEKGQQQNGTQQKPLSAAEESSSSSLFSSAADQLRSLWRRLSIVGRSDEEQKDELKHQPMLILALRVNNIDTVVLPFGTDGKKRPNSLITTMKKMLTVGIGSIGRLTGIGQQKRSIDASGILFWHERAARVPMSTGQQLHIQQKSFAFGTIKAKAQRLGHSQIGLQLHPSATFGRIQKMKAWASPVHSLGVKHIGAIEANLPLYAQLNTLSQQKQVTLNVQVPKTPTRLFFLHTLPMTFVGTENVQNARPQQRSAFLHFGEQCKAVQNQQLLSMAMAFDKHSDTEQSLLQLPFHARGILHRPRRMDKLKEWVKVLLSTENHFQLSLMPTSSISPHEIAFSIGWDLSRPQPTISEALSHIGFKEWPKAFTSTASDIERKNNENEETEEDDGQWGTEATAASSSEEEKTTQRTKNRQIGEYLKKLGAEKAYKHMLKFEMGTIGNDENRRAELTLNTLCDSRLRFCALRAKTEQSVVGDQRPQWTADLRVQFLFPEQAPDLEQVGQHNRTKPEQQQKMFMGRTEFEWKGDGLPKQTINVSIIGEPSEEMLQLAHQFAEQSFSRRNGTDHHQKHLPITAGHPFVNKYKMAADWTLRTDTQNAFLRGLEAVKSAHFFNAASKVILSKNGEDSEKSDRKMGRKERTDRGRTLATLSIDPLTHRHLDASVRTSAQLTFFRTVPVASPLRPFPLVRPSHRPFSRASSASLPQFFHNIAHPLRSRAVCRVDSPARQLRTFDGAQLDVHFSPCWTVLAKDCSAEGRAQFAVLLKTKANSEQMKLKVISPEIGILVVEPHAKQPNSKLQVQISGKDQQKRIVSSDTPLSDIPNGIQFDRSLPTKKEALIVEWTTSNANSEGSVGATGAISVHFDGQKVQILLDGQQNRHHSCGLCGDWNGNAGDEFRMPNGGQTESAKEFHRAYSLVDGEGEEDGECEDSAILDKFHSEKAEENETNEPKQQKSSEEKPKTERIAAVRKTIVIEHPHQLCFSVHPTKQCPSGTFAIGTDKKEKRREGKEKKEGKEEEEKEKEEEPKQRKMPFACVERHSTEAKRLQSQTRRGEVVQMGDGSLPISFHEIVIEAEQCMDSEGEFKQLLVNCLSASFFPLNASPPAVQSRNTAPFVMTSASDARGDAVSLLVDKMVHSQIPLRSAYILAYEFVDIYADKLHTHRNSFTETQKIDASNWCSELRECFAQFLQQIVDGSRPLPPSLFSHCHVLPLSFCAQKNRKPKMEDRYLLLPSLDIVEPKISKKVDPSAALFAVFDGHNGAECATFASAHLTECFLDAFEQSDDVEKVLNDAIERLDKRITDKCTSENIKSGTTVSCVYLEGTTSAYLAWCGDSAIGLLTDTAVDTLSTPHKPEDEDEMRRIEQAGGMVVSIHGVPRLNGVLNLSRSLGDVMAKPMVSSVPDVKRVSLSPDHGHNILFVATDGVWDTLEEEEIFEACRQFIATRPPKDFEFLADFIVDKAKSAGASDNLTLICVFLRPIDELWAKFRN
ncbi:hypothetical protein niasHS_006881 [Heterodera schachtii]|uniref:Vitellogenin domain-containing protein n=1 Tax=Heterodera schachtii TaxID=97005 RepID=A0ABD2JG62_HETSC